MKKVNVTMNLPVNVELMVEPIADNEDFDVKSVRVMTIQGITVSDVNENLDSNTADEIVRQLEKG